MDRKRLVVLIFVLIKLTTVAAILKGLQILKPNPKPWLGDKVDSGLGLPQPMLYVGVDSGVDIRWGYSQLLHRV